MKEYTILILTIFLLLGCGQTKRQNFTTANKGLSYSFSSLEGIILYTKK